MNPSSTQEKPRFRASRCTNCGLGYVVPTSRDGRFVEYKEMTINLPMSVYIPTCGSCRAEFYPPEVKEEIKRVLEAEYKLAEPEIAKALDRLRRRKGIN